MCWYCGLPVTDAEPIGRSMRCQNCGKDLRVCKHCRFFAPGSRGDCRETSAEKQTDKERSNFCDWFSLDVKFRSLAPEMSDEKEKANVSRTALESLFS
ncbi:MAG: hypothetical protein FWC03_12125 [Treponema sp.]|nr:hypothetical protein [Treponema sp.]